MAEQWETQGDILRTLPRRQTRPPRNFKELYHLLGMCQPKDGLDGLLKLIDFSIGSVAEITSLLDRQSRSAASPNGDPEGEFRTALLSNDFRTRVLQTILSTYPEKGRDVFIHVPKCAGTDLILSLTAHSLPIPKTLESRDWLPDEAFIGCLSALARLVPFHDRFFVYGHMELADYVQTCGVRWSDRIFTIIRDPIDMMISQANYAVGRLRQDPTGREPDTAETLQYLGLERLPEDASDGDLKDLAVRALFDARIARPNLACLHLADSANADAASAMKNLVAYNVEVTTIDHYERWLGERWGIEKSEKHNRSAPILRRSEVVRSYAAQIRLVTAQDQKLYDAVCRSIEKTGSASTTGERIGALNPVDIPDPGASIDYPTAGTVLLVAQEPDNVAMYLRPLSAAVPGSRRCEEILSVDFGLEGTGKRYQLSGWSDTESTYTWTNASESQLEFPPLPAGGQLVLQLVGNPFIAKPHLARQRIGVAINNELLGDFEIDDIAVVETEIPPHIAGSGRPIRVTLRLYDAAKPATYGDPNDDRMLAFALHRIAVLHFEKTEVDVPKTDVAPVPAGVEDCHQSCSLVTSEENLGERMVESRPADKLTVDFGAHGNSARYCRGGWSRPEPAHTWTSGYESALELPLPERAGDYLLHLTLGPFVWKDKIPAQKLVVVVNGKEVQTSQVRERASLEYRLPWELLEGRDPISIVFHHPDAATPVEINGVPDDRLIAFAFENITLAKSLEDAPAKLRGGADRVAAANGSDGVPLSELALKFENLGENCEFGLVQRRFGAEPLGLLRFSSTPILKLIDALNLRFEDLGKPDLVEVRASEKEYMVLDKKFGFLYHPWVSLGDADPKEIHARECGRLPFLVSKLIEDLEDGQKIFVYHGMRTLSETIILRLVEALRRYSKATLLWVEVEDEANPAGTVKELTEGLLKGYIDRFAPGENAHDISLESWVTICRNAYALAQRSELVAQ